MSYRPTRRDFLGDAAKAGVASAWKLDLSAISAMPAQPQRRSNLDAQWKFVKGDPQGAQSPDFNDASWKTLDLPHDWSIEGPFSEEAPAAGNGAYLPTGIGWYRKHFTLPAATRRKRVLLQFDGVYQCSEVWMNGTSLGVRPYGFTTFDYDLTEHLKPAGKTNQIAVRVDNSLQPNCRWYTGSGIYRHTWLIITDPLHLAQWGTFVTTPMVSPQNAAVEITTRVLNESVRDAACELKTEVVDPKGTVVQQASSTMSIQAKGEASFRQRLQIASPALWSVSTPNLYTLRTTLHSHGQQLDQDSTVFGIREVKFDADRGFLLNGEHVKMNGVCIHGDCGSVGTAVPERMWERRLELLKQMGCNSIRLSHNPPAPELLDLLDNMGFLVMAEAFDVLHLFPHWNWAGREGKVITVTCYTNCDTVELFLNGKSFGVKGYAFPRPGMVGTYGNYPERAKAVQTTADLHLSWDLPFTAGTLTAKGVKDGKLIRTVEIETTGSPAKLGLAVDRPRISREPSDVAHVTVKVLDRQGRVVPSANDEITFAVTGAGRILGVDNGQPDSHESYQGLSRKAFNGLALVVLQATGAPGTVTLSASCPALSPAHVDIEVG
jgi:Glycoside hydrolase family 2 C-terminal domain 5/Glycosyl hydrolases family 2, sugar binding domain/Glycosyl hydrolases family 2/Domain of unknown function (DUF4982)/Glycosyl hydrolases family 2, TIM barrel domain